ncbi:hypothetical protein FVER14953_20959 [Fusarium verticillioides]|nr:hypothetical protein FVER14953_20959 [Fusarium verticillioides]
MDISLWDHGVRPILRYSLPFLPDYSDCFPTLIVNTPDSALYLSDHGCGAKRLLLLDESDRLIEFFEFNGGFDERWKFVANL